MGKKCQHSLYLNNKIPPNLPRQNHRSGTAFILTDKIKDNSQIKEHILLENRIQIISITKSCSRIKIINCYYPQREKERFDITKKIDHFLENGEPTHAIIAGDFNFVEASIDTLNQENFKFTKDKKAFLILRENHFLTDVYREKNPLKKVFTYLHPRGSTRIDRIYVNESLVPIPVIKKNRLFSIYSN